MSAFAALLRRDLLLAYRQGIDGWVVVLFFLAAGILFPFAIGPEPNALMRVSTGVVLCMAALAALLSLDRLYQADFDDGSLDQIALSPLPLELTALSKALVHWLSTGLPLLAAAPILALMLNAPVDQYGALLLALALATPALSLLGGLGAALTMGSRRGGILLTLLILPLYVPVLIFAAGAIGFAGAAGGLSEEAAGHGFGAHLLLLGGVDLALLAVTPWATAAALRQALRA